MFNIVKEWKQFSVDLKDFHIWMQANAGASFCGLSADSVLTVHFTEEPSSEIKAAIDAKWDSLAEVAELIKMSHYDELDAAETEAKEAILLLGWDDMIPAERKIAMSRALTDEDKEALLVKYPQV